MPTSFFPRLVWLQTHQRWDVQGCRSALVSPWRCPAGHTAVSCSSPSHLCLRLLFPCNLFSFLCPLSGLACNSGKSWAIQVRQAVSHLCGPGFWPGLAQDTRCPAQPCRGCGERAGLPLCFFLLESSNGAEAAAAVEQPGLRSAEPELGTAPRRRWSSRAAGACPLAAAAPPDPLALRLRNLIFMYYFFPYCISSTLLHWPRGAELSPLHPTGWAWGCGGSGLLLRYNAFAPALGSPCKTELCSSPLLIRGWIFSASPLQGP